MANQQTNQTANQQLKDQLDSYKNRVNKSRRLKRISFIVGLCLVAVAIVGLVLPAATLEYGKTYCGQEEHTHTDACVNRTLVCSLPDTSNGNGHVHVPSCYDEQSPLAICGKTPVAHMHIPACVNAEGTQLICGQEENVHMHTLACVDEATNTYKCGAEDLAHVHGVTCYSLGPDGSYVLVCDQPSEGHVHTMLCLDPETGEVVCGQEEAIELSHAHTDACYEEELICGMEEHVHNELCYDEITEAIMKKDEESSAAKEAAEDVEGSDDGVAEGDLTAEEIAEAKDQGLLFENEDVIVIFDVPEKYKDDIQLTVTETDDEVEFVEATDATEEVNAEGEPVNDEAVQNGDNGEPVFVEAEEKANNGSSDEVVGEELSNGVATNDQSTTVVYADDENEPYKEFVPAKDTTIVPSEDEHAYKINLHVVAELDGKPIEDIAKLDIKAKLQMKAKVIAPILAEIDYSTIDPTIMDEVGAEISILQQPMSYSNATISDMKAEQVDEIIATSVQSATTTFDLLSNDFTAKANGTTDKNFTVYYVAPVPKPALGDSGQLQVIDTTGGVLPTNSSDLVTQQLTIKSDGTIKTMSTEVEIFESAEYQYYKAPTLNHFNKLSKNSNYELKKIRVETKGETTTYDYDPAQPETNIHFTNRAESIGLHNGVNYVLIDDGTIITLVFNPTKNPVPLLSSFYDYDISDGYIYRTAAGAAIQDPVEQRLTSKQDQDNWAYYRHANTLEKGINSEDNYPKTEGTKLAFGNVNTGTGLGTQQWGKNYLNMFNYFGSSLGCTFGLVDGLNDDGEIQYANGVIAPNLFNEEGTVTGKTTYNNSELNFSRVGDTYTLTSTTVDGKTTGGLSSFGNPGGRTDILTNNFWPLDDTGSYGTDGHDLRFGSSSLEDKRIYVGKAEKYKKPNGEEPEKEYKGYFPKSDDGLDHNSYFGMHYDVNFRLTKDYCGPLEYIFFGDDDLWVFLDGTLVVDIGGVHSAVGEYVNLWDYISKGSEGDHTLSVFYTERGGSGSTCYMNFTLPSVSNIPVPDDTGELTIVKEVVAPKDSPHLKKEFNFSIHLTDESGQNRLVDDYSYTRYNAKGDEIESDLVIWDNGTFSLKNGEYITIKYLPKDAKYEIQELLAEDGSDPYQVQWEYFESSSTPTSTGLGKGLGIPPDPYEGQIGEPADKATYRLKYTNTVPYELPATGGIGAHWYWIGGGLLVALALLMLWRRQATASAVAACAISPAEASVLALFGDASFASPSGTPESTYKKGRHHIWRDDGHTRKGGNK